MPYIIQTASARMPGSCKGQYKRIGLIEVESGYDHVAMISNRAHGVVRVIETWEKLHVGKTARCAFARAMADAKARLASLA